MLLVKLKRLCGAARLPVKGTSGSAYYDLYAAEDCDIWVGQTKTLATGWRIEVPRDWFLDIRSRSGMAAKGVFVTNSPGTVDADYRGELKVILTNCSGYLYQVKIGDRIAQCALMPMHENVFMEVADLSVTERGAKGYGSTGV